jgi:hypothetical protein
MISTMTSKPLQLTVAILAGALLGVFGAHYFLNRPPAPTPYADQRSEGVGHQSDESALQPKTENLKPSAVPPLRSQVSALIPQISALSPSATLSISSFTETRSQITSPSASSPQFAGLRLELLFSGEAVNRALKYGNVQITKAVDNAGNDLIIQRAERPGGFVTNSLPVLRPIEPPNPQGRPPGMPFLFPRPAGTRTASGTSTNSANAADIKTESVKSEPSVVKENPSAEPKTQNQKPSATPQTVRLPIHLKTPPRTSTALKELEGTLQFLQTAGTLEIKTPAVKTLEGKPIESPELQNVPVKFTVHPPPKSSFVTDPARAVALRISGLKDAILRVSFVDKDNKPVRTTNSWYSPSPGVEDWTYVFEKPVTEEVTLMLKPTL